MPESDLAMPAPEDLTPDGGPTSDETPAAPVRSTRKRESVFADPVVRLLTGGLVVVVILFLSTIVAALMLGVLGDNTPRTTRERDLIVGQYEVEAGNTDPFVWKQYISALIDSGRFEEAQRVIDRGMQAIDNRPGADMTFAQAQLYYSSGEFLDAIETATEGMDALTAYHEAQKNTEGSPEAKGQPINENYWGMLYLRAVSYRDSGDLEAALADFDTYLAEKKAASNVLVERGDVRLDLGDREGAEADYRQALVHIPDYQPAIDALENLGVER